MGFRRDQNPIDDRRGGALGDKASHAGEKAVEDGAKDFENRLKDREERADPHCRVAFFP
jgi:hypothetical protein